MNKISKILLPGLISFLLLGTSSIPAFASTNVSSNIKAVSAAVATSNGVLVDGSSSTQTISGGNIGVFTINTTDTDLRQLVVSSSAPVKSIIVPNNSALANFIWFSSGDYRTFNLIGWHFMPGIQYNLLVTPQSTAAVTVSLSKASGILSWVNVNGASVIEQNILSGGQVEQYGLAFQTSGKYRVTVKTVSKLTAYFYDSTNPNQSKTVPLANSTYVFDNLTINATGQNQANYGLILTSNDVLGSGGAYTVTIERIG